MSELIEPNKRTAETETYEDLFDALKIAFWNEDFEDCESASLPLVVFDDETRSCCQMKRKTEFDDFRGCSVNVTHFKYSSERGAVIVPHEYLMIDWEDGKNKNILMSIHELELGYFVYEDGTDNNEYMRTKGKNFKPEKELAKQALGAVSTQYGV